MESNTEHVGAINRPGHLDGQEEQKVAADNSAAEVSGEDIAEAVDYETPRPVRQQPGASITVERKKVEVEERAPVEINLRTMLEAGVHFGHQTSRWTPAMRPFIHTSRNGIHIISLPKTLQQWQVARKTIVDIAAAGGNALFVGTKKQSQEIIEEEATRCGAFYVARRWLGGMMTNFQTIRKSVDRMKRLETILSEEDQALQRGESLKFTKKERLLMAREWEKLDYSLSGIRDMHGVPQLLFIVDIKREDIAVREAKRLDIPIVALVDTNCDPQTVDHAIPSNDDGTRAIKLFVSAVADALAEGKRKYVAKGSPRVGEGDFNGEKKSSSKPSKEKKAKSE